MKLWRAFLFLVAALPHPLYSQSSPRPDPQDRRIDRLEQKINEIEANTNYERASSDRLEQKISDLEAHTRVPPPVVDEGGIAFICGLVCAFWAQHTRRNAWLWFFFGLFCTVIALVVLLYKNSNDIFLRDDARRRHRLFPGSRQPPP
jgi:hypothetical protein